MCGDVHALGVELEIGRMKDNSLNYQIKTEIGFIEALALETNRVRGRSQRSVVLEWEKADMDDYSVWALADDASIEVEDERHCE